MGRGGEKKKKKRDSIENSQDVGCVGPEGGKKQLRAFSRRSESGKKKKGGETRAALRILPPGTPSTGRKEKGRKLLATRVGKEKKKGKNVVHRDWGRKS